MIVDASLLLVWLLYSIPFLPPLFLHHTLLLVRYNASTIRRGSFDKSPPLVRDLTQQKEWKGQGRRRSSLWAPVLLVCEWREAVACTIC